MRASPRECPYEPHGAAIAALLDFSSELLISGPAGTGKSRILLEKLYDAAYRYPGMRGLIVRQVRASLTETGLVTWEKVVVPPGHPILTGPSRGSRRSYVFPNGSEIVVGGLDKPDKIMSSEYDLIYAQESIELKEDGWEALTTRLRNGVMPYQQLMADCNPSSPSHGSRSGATWGAPSSSTRGTRTTRDSTRTARGPRSASSTSPSWTT